MPAFSESLAVVAAATFAGAVAVPVINRFIDCVPGLLPAELSAVLVAVARSGGTRPPEPIGRFRRAVLWGTVPAFSAGLGLHFGAAPALAWALVLFWGLTALFALDAEAEVLPDALTLPLTLAGLCANLGGNFFCSLEESVLGAALGYGFLVTCALAGRALGMRDPLGGGDQKAAAMLGAWYGAWALPHLVLAVAVLALLVVSLRRASGTPVSALPLGPCFAVVGTAALFVLGPGSLF